MKMVRSKVFVVVQLALLVGCAPAKSPTERHQEQVASQAEACRGYEADCERACEHGRELVCEALRVGGLRSSDSSRGTASSKQAKANADGGKPSQSSENVLAEARELNARANEYIRKSFPQQDMRKVTELAAAAAKKAKRVRGENSKDWLSNVGPSWIADARKLLEEATIEETRVVQARAAAIESAADRKGQLASARRNCAANQMKCEVACNGGDQLSCVGLAEALYVRSPENWGQVESLLTVACKNGIAAGCTSVKEIASQENSKLKAFDQSWSSIAYNIDEISTLQFRLRLAKKVGYSRATLRAIPRMAADIGRTHQRRLLSNQTSVRGRVRPSGIREVGQDEVRRRSPWYKWAPRRSCDAHLGLSKPNCQSLRRISVS